MNHYSKDQGIVNALSFDLEEWFHGLRVSDPGRYASRLEMEVEPVLAMLNRFDVKATFFVLASLAGSHKRLLRRIAAQGHEIGSHGLHHVPIYEQSPAQFHRELEASVTALEDAVGERVIGHRAPFFSITPQTLWALDMVAESGLVYDSSVFPVVNPRYGIPAASRFPHRLASGLVELPISTLRIEAAGVNVPFSGGFYARFWGAQAVQWGIGRLNAHGLPALVYFHPWEMDPEHPRIWSRAVPALYHLTHYYRLDCTLAILSTVLEKFYFVPLRHIAAQYEGANSGLLAPYDRITEHMSMSGQP